VSDPVPSVPAIPIQVPSICPVRSRLGGSVRATVDKTARKVFALQSLALERVWQPGKQEKRKKRKICNTRPKWDWMKI
jgi:hypothetical protein